MPYKTAMEKAVFLDRDGVIIEDAGYVGEIERVKFIPAAGKAIRLLNENDFKVIIITNQAGVARGYFSEEAVEEINTYVQETLAEEGALIDKIYYCPHYKEGIIEEYRKDCYYRKPSPGMIEEAVRDFHIDLKRSFLIGDKSSDIEAGNRAGCKTILLAGENTRGSAGGSGIVSDHIAPDLYGAVKWLVGHGAEKVSPHAKG